MAVSATFSSQEGAALERAMARVETSDSTDVRGRGERDSDTFMAVCMHVLEAAAGVGASSGQSPAQVDALAGAPPVRDVASLGP